MNYMFVFNATAFAPVSVKMSKRILGVQCIFLITALVLFLNVLCIYLSLSAGNNFYYYIFHLYCAKQGLYYKFAFMCIQFDILRTGSLFPCMLQVMCCKNYLSIIKLGKLYLL